MIHIYLKREKNYDNCKYWSGDTHYVVLRFSFDKTM